MKIFKSMRYYWLVIFIGLTAMVGQLSLIRFAAISFYGNELTMCIVMGHWLLWTSIGSMVGSHVVDRINVKHGLFILATLYGFILIGFSYVLLLVRKIAGISSSEIISLETIFLWTFLIFVIPALLNGLFFPFLVKWLKIKTQRSRVHFVYASETFGSALGSLCFAALIYLGFHTFDNLHIIVGLLLILVAVYFISKKLSRLVYLIFIVSILAYSGVIGTKNSLKFKWAPYHLKAFTESAYTAITHLEYEDMEVIFANSEPLWTVDDQERAEELVHFDMLSHPHPQEVLLVGLGNPDIYQELFKYNNIRSLTVLQSDSILQNKVNSLARQPLEQYSIRWIFQDPIGWLHEQHNRFDVVILNIPLPVNAQWNRYYTRSFFRSIRQNMSDNGLISIPLPAGENYLLEEKLRFLKTIQNTVKDVFPFTAWVPGQTAHLIGSEKPVKIEAEYFITEMQQRDIETRYIQEYYLVDRLSPMKIDFLKRQLAQIETTEINTLLAPVGFYYDTVLWAQRTAGVLAKVYQKLYTVSRIYFIAVIGFILIAIYTWFLSTRRIAGLINFNMAAVGFYVMSLETVLILIFQSYVGALYLRIVFLMCAFMLGAAMGAAGHHFLPQPKNFTHLYRQLSGFLVLPILMILGLNITLQDWVFSLLILLSLFTAGMISGFIFPSLTALWQKYTFRSAAAASGRIYGGDILGSCLGVYLISALVLPIWGIMTALIVLQLLAVVVFIANYLVRRI